MDLTKRQLDILIAIIEQYAELAVPVGSVILAKLFNVSSATIRLEMARLEELGLIKQPYTSAGRIPTDRGYRVYVNYLTEQRQNDQHPVLTTDRIKQAFIQQMVNSGQSADKIIRRAVRGLADWTENLGFATIGDQIYTCGLANLFNHPDFIEREELLALSNLIDNLEPWLAEAQPSRAVNVFIGSENPIGKTSGASLIISKFNSPFSERSYIGVLGPRRQSYAKVMRLVEQTGQLLEEIL
ncbi:MAG: transcriptional regulator [Candidatus Saccharibacteria bacterium]|nr:transcriptional regulator [Candidatus Saccharibacteria bacterium]